ncbi:hypothetical protein MASR2M78_09730 [Treponema sp.]
MKLNSILLEGTIIDTPTYSEASASTPDRTDFTIDCGPVAPAIPVLIEGPSRAGIAAWASRTTVRVIGRLHHDAEATARTGHFSLVVLVDHVEVKPTAVARTEVA